MQCKSTGGAEQGWSWLSAVLVPWPSGWCWTRRGQNGKLADIVNTLPTIRTFIMQHNWVTRDTRNYHRDLKKTLIKTPLSSQSKSVSSEDPVSDRVAEVVWGWRGWCVRGGGPCVCMTAASGLTTAVRRAHHEGEHNRTRCGVSTIYQYIPCRKGTNEKLQKAATMAFLLCRKDVSTSCPHSLSWSVYVWRQLVAIFCEANARF